MVLLSSRMLPLGSPAYDFKLQGIDDKWHTLQDYSEQSILVLIFMCNHCPYVQAIWDNLITLAKQETEVQFVGINSNSNPNYPEDSFEKMKEYAKEKDQTFPYLYDEHQEAAKAYGAECTPDFFVYGPERTLVYRGSFAGLENALKHLKQGEKVPEDQKPSMGCSIKWV